LKHPRKPIASDIIWLAGLPGGNFTGRDRKMKKRDKEKLPAKKKKAEDDNKKWSEKKKNIKIRKEALKKIIDHFNDPDKKDEH
jgi:hypothetical protein